MDLIIGAGITGLSYAANTTNEYLVLEKSSEIGGYCKTIHEKGFTWDYSGHFFHSRNEGIKTWLMDGIDKNDILEIEKCSQIKYKDLNIDYPFQSHIHQLHKEEFIDCLFDLFNNSYSTYKSFKEMLYSKFGKSIAEKFLVPYNEKLYACSLDDLDASAMGRFFPSVNKKEIIANFKQKNSDSYNSTFIYPRNGAFEYIKSILRFIDLDKINLNEYILGLDATKQLAYTNKRVIKYDNLISTIPFPYLLDIAKIDYDKSLYTSNKVLVFNIGFDKKGLDIKNDWLYFPEKKYPFYRVGFYDNILKEKRLSIYVEIGLAATDSVNIEKLFLDTLNGLRDAGIIQNHKIIAKNSLIINPGYVHISNEMILDRNEQMNKLTNINVFSIGRYGGWTYSSMEDDIIKAKNLAQRLNNLY